MPGGRGSRVHLQVAQRGNLRRSARIRTLYHDVRRSCAQFDNLHLRSTAPLPMEMCARILDLSRRSLALCRRVAHPSMDSILVSQTTADHLTLSLPASAPRMFRPNQTVT